MGTLWSKIPPQEQKLILGAIAAVLGSGALVLTGNAQHLATFDGSVASVALLRYLTDVIQRQTGDTIAVKEPVPAQTPVVLPPMVSTSSSWTAATPLPAASAMSTYPSTNPPPVTGNIPPSP